MISIGKQRIMHRLELALCNLPPLQREIFLARRLRSLSDGDIAAMTGLDVSEVQALLADAIAAFAKALEG